MPGFTGDPTWPEQVLRADLGDRLVVHDGWQTAGTGSARTVGWAISGAWMIHHTGNSRETWEPSATAATTFLRPLALPPYHPRQEMPPLIAIGPMQSRQDRDYGPLDDDGNQRLIAFECAWPTIRPRRLRRLNEAVAGHADHHYARRHRRRPPPPDYGQLLLIATRTTLARQGQWDPGNIDMAWFRGEVQKTSRAVPVPRRGQARHFGARPALPPDYAKEVWDLLRSRTRRARRPGPSSAHPAELLWLAKPRRTRPGSGSAGTE